MEQSQIHIFQSTVVKQDKLNSKVAEDVVQTNLGADMKLPMSLILDAFQVHAACGYWPAVNLS